MKEGTRTMIDRVVLYGLSCLNLSGMNYLFLEILYLENSLYSNNFIKKTPEELSIVPLNWTRFIFWHIGLPINCRGKLRGTIRTRLSLLTNAYLFLHNCATLTSLPRQSIWNARNICSPLRGYLCSAKSLRVYVIFNIVSKPMPTLVVQREGGRKQSEGRQRNGVLLLQQKGWRDKFGKGSVLSKIKISFGQARGFSISILEAV